MYITTLMKQTLFKKLSVAATLLVTLASCSGDETILLPPDNSNIGQITTELPFAKQGRPYTPACPLLPSQYADNVTARWSDSTGELLNEDRQSDGISYKTFRWDKAGTQEVTCQMNYNYADEEKELRQTKTIEVLPPLLLDCHFLDNIEEVKEKHPLLTQVVKSVAGSTIETYTDNSDTKEHTFFFTNSRLTRIQGTETTEKKDFYQELLSLIENAYDGQADDLEFRGTILGEPVLTHEETDILKKITNKETLTPEEKEIVNRLIENERLYLTVSLTKEFSTVSSKMTFGFVRQNSGYILSRQYICELK